MEKNSQFLFLLCICIGIRFISFGGPGVEFTKEKGDVYILSIGINNYSIKNLSIQSKNAASDAKHFSAFIKQQSGNRKVIEFTLTNEQATLDSVVSIINFINNQSQKEDYFFFNFGGFSWDYPPDLLDIHFFLYDKKEIDVKENSLPDLSRTISLKKLQSLLEFNKAKNQLLFSEAGSSANFRKIMQKSLIEIDQNLSAILDRNRVVIAPRNIGLDSFRCDSTYQMMGPLMYFVTNGFPKNIGITIFDLFSEEISERNRAEYAIMKAEVSCDMLVKMYSGIYFEKDLMKDLADALEKKQTSDEEYSNDKSLTEETLVKTEETTAKTILSTSGRQQIHSSKALLVAVDKYVKGSGWKKLYNPLEDADTIAQLLSKNYNFEVEVLKNPSKDSILVAMKRYANSLDTNDQFLFYFSGHGYFDTTFYHDGFFVMQDCENPALDPTLSKYLPFNSIRSILDNLKSKQVMFIVDACFSGKVDEKEMAINNGKITIDQLAVKNMMDNLKPAPSFTEDELNELSRDYQNVTSGKYISEILKKKTRILLAAGSKKVPDGYAGKHSPMTALLIKVLELKGGSKNFLTSNDLYRYVSTLPSRPVLGQLPQDQNGEFLLKPIE